MANSNSKRGDIKNLIGKRVIHILPGGKPGRYGSGTIVKPTSEAKTDHVYVKFDENDTIKTFLYPDCFESFLKLEDTALAKRMKEINSACKIVQERSCRSENTSRKMNSNNTESVEDILLELDKLIGLEEVKNEVRILASCTDILNL